MPNITTAKEILAQIAANYPTEQAVMPTGENVTWAGYISAVKESSNMHRYSSHALAAAVIPQTIFFDQPEIYGISNLVTAGQLPYDAFIMGFAVEFNTGLAATALADAQTFRRETEFNLLIASKNTPTFPSFTIPSGNGLKMIAADAGAGVGAVQYAASGISNNAEVFTRPFFLKQGWQIQGRMNSAALVALNAVAVVRLSIRGIEIRRVG